MKNILQILFIFVIIFSCDQKRSSEKKDIPKWWTEKDRKLIIWELDRTTDKLKNAIENLSNDQWNFKEDKSKWSIAEIVEHLEMQNQLHYRKLTTTTKPSRYLQFRQVTEGQDRYFSKFSTDTIQGKTCRFSEPSGKYFLVKDAQFDFYKTHQNVIQFLEKTDIDLRKRFVYLVPIDHKENVDVKAGEVCDLHQLLLTGIAHIRWHLKQITRIKQRSDFPQKLVTLQGVIQISGLSENQKEEFDLSYSDHLFLAEDKAHYLMETKSDFLKYIGQFCEVNARAMNNNNLIGLGYKAIEVDDIKIRNFVPDYSQRDSLIRKEIKYFREQYHRNEPDTIFGYLIRTERHEPGSFSFYSIIVDIPIEYSGSQATDQVEHISKIPLGYIDLTMLLDFETYIEEHKSIKLIGFLHSGYAHRLAFSTIKIADSTDRSLE